MVKWQLLQRDAARLAAELARLHGTGERVLDVALSRRQRSLVDLEDDDVAPGTRAHLGDARPHQPAPDDADLDPTFTRRAVP